MLCVMAMNSQGNQAPHIPINNFSRSESISEQRITSNFDVTINATDVLCGRGKSSFTHAGNRRFRDTITNAIDEYNSSDSRLAKSRVVHRIVDKIKGEGGRFLKRERATGRWVELDTKSCRDKVGHAIRDAANLIEARKQKQQRRRDAFAHLEQKTGNVSGFRDDERLPFSIGGMKESNRSWSRLEESKLSSNDDDDDEIFFETESQKSYAEEVDDDYASEDDSFVKYINDVLGPIHPNEKIIDPLWDFHLD